MSLVPEKSAGLAENCLLFLSLKKNCKMATEIPRFIRLRGCINCDISHRHKEKTGKDYGFDHELVAGCLLYGCVGYGHDLSNPFMDPEELMKKAKEMGLQ